ncbi:metallophosphoesterase family protein [Pseudomonas sp. NCCP-436]|uniref:metallophosphoesterase family protein n=1 Tax=Pseudomonas sp. NCCP-436 TaxID=2842481 RepID=UPI001C814A1B|nr:metallophosphoesterase family protein [Pseudomonas sp. NCCP-436]GIZ12543.1 phosphoesterase [Pseudomonas sp. NCCP-436]
MTRRTIGLIADTHGLLRAEALAALRGVDQLIHAGDIGGPQILAELERLAPLSVVRGNNDKGIWAEAIPERLTLRLGAVAIHVLHDLKQLNLDPATEGISVVVAGHSHKPLHEYRNGALYLNPGSAGPRRFRLPIGVARLKIDGDKAQAELLELQV